jgi:hypothetical protein
MERVVERLDRVTERMDRAMDGLEGITGSALKVPEQLSRLGKLGRGGREEKPS